MKETLLCLRWPYLDFLNLWWRSYLLQHIVCLVFVNLLQTVIFQNWNHTPVLSFNCISAWTWSLDLFSQLTPFTGYSGSFPAISLHLVSDSGRAWLLWVDNLFLAGSQKLKLENFMTHFTPQIEYKICRKNIRRKSLLNREMRCNISCWDALLSESYHWAESWECWEWVLEKMHPENENQEMAHLFWALITKN